MPPALQPSTQAIGSSASVSDIAVSSAGVSSTDRSPYATVSRTAALVARAVTPAARADLLIGMPAGPSPERTPRTETVRSQGTVLPAVASTATPEASQVVRSSPRRVSPREVGAVDGRSSAPDSRSAPNAARITGSFTAMCTTSAPIATQPTA